MAVLLSQILGGPRHYDGRDLTVAHRRQGITDQH
jgi:hypothetical protein